MARRMRIEDENRTGRESEPEIEHESVIKKTSKPTGVKYRARYRADTPTDNNSSRDNELECEVGFITRDVLWKRCARRRCARAYDLISARVSTPNSVLICHSFISFERRAGPSKSRSAK